MVIASQIIHSSTETYYLNRSVSYGMQAAQIVSTEIRGEIEDALPLCLYDTGKGDYSSYYINICNQENNKYIELIASDGKQVKFSLENNGVLVLKKYLLNKDAYNTQNMKRDIDVQNGVDLSGIQYRFDPEKIYDSKYIGMGYEVKNISITKFNDDKNVQNWDSNKNGKIELDIGNYPVLELVVTVSNHQYEEYECKEYIPLYNFYGIIDDITTFETMVNISS